MNIPNILTFVRICIIPFFVHAIFTGKSELAAVLLVLSGVTDVLDGFLARRFTLVTKWGSVFDPIADKLTQLTASFCIAYKGFRPMWFVFAFLLIKELVFAFGGIRLYRRDETVVMAKWYGKAATVVLYCTFLALILFNLPSGAKIFLICVALAFSFMSLINYARVFMKLQKQHN